jgi:hypothetical protein
MNDSAIGSSGVAAGATARRWLWAVALLALGALLGSTFARQAAPIESVGAEARSSPAEGAQWLGATTTPSSQSAELSRKMLQVLAQPQASGPTPTDDPHVHEPSTEELVDTVRLQPRDEAWANGAEVILEQDLTRLAAQLKFRVGEVDCRSSRCLVQLEWPNGAAAQRDFKAAMARDAYRLDCHRRLLLPPTDSASGHAQLIMDCENQLQRAKAPESVAPLR